MARGVLMTTLPVYTTRETVKAELPIAGASLDALIDRKIAAASRGIERLTLRRFYPWTGVKYFDWPNDQRARAWSLYFDHPDQLVSLTSLTSGGTTIAVASTNVEPVNEGP